jgi:tetratricopeptide (TPR) repeat protein
MDSHNLQLIDYWIQNEHKESAKPLLIEILERDPHNIEAIQRFALVWPQEAHQLLSKIVGGPNCPPIIQMILGDLYLEQGNPRSAIQHYNSFISSSKPSFEVLHNLGLAYAQLFLFKEAVSQFEKAEKFNPDSFELHINWGAALKNLGLYDESLNHLLKAEALNPSDSRVWLNKGVTLEAINQQEQAIESYDFALKINPKYLEAFCNKANALMAIGHHEEAFLAFQNALSINRNDPDTLYNLSFLQLHHGNYEEGWKNYENRWFRENAPIRPFDHIQPLANLDNIHGKHILVWSEQGLGDSIQFCRFIPDLAKKGAAISFLTQPELIEILSTVEGIREIISQNEEVSGSFDAQIPLMSLPLLFQNTKEQFPSTFPYIRCNTSKSDNWQKRLQDIQKLKVGLVWSGGFRPDQPELWAVNARRNIPFSVIARLKDIQGIQFISLQKGLPAEAELARERPIIWPNNNLSVFTSDLNSFEDTAALIENLDLVISVDTSIAHLAGALGKPIWILNRYDSCWRWLKQEQKTHWYPNAKIFNQPSPGNWDDVIKEVYAELMKIAASKLAML